MEIWVLVHHSVWNTEAGGRGFVPGYGCWDWRFYGYRCEQFKGWEYQGVWIPVGRSESTAVQCVVWLDNLGFEWLTKEITEDDNIDESTGWKDWPHDYRGSHYKV